MKWIPANLKRLVVMHKPYRGRLSLAFVAMIISSCSEPIIPFFFQMLLDHGFKEGSDFPYWYVPAVVIGLFC
ncbi:MAG: lipid ABC transporter permease/ATP-binding protein, partial [Burkholderiaceae bacterium]|nr:lipid ABC transporter permease/ATP-binding protein [Burkholderiaceae bacterium]